MRQNKNSYDKDFYNWALSQSNFLKSGKLDKLDIENLAEEIKSLGNSERDKLESHLANLLMHMLKSKYQEQLKSRSWDLSIKNARFHAKKVLKNNPSLKSKLHELCKDAYYSARLEAAIETGLPERIFPKDCEWSIEEILGEKIKPSSL